MYNQAQWEFFWPTEMAAKALELGLTLTAVERMYDGAGSLRFCPAPGTREVVGYARPSKPVRMAVRLDEGPTWRLLVVTDLELLSPEVVEAARRAAGG